MLKGSSDFFGLNHYSTDFVSQGEQPASIAATLQIPCVLLSVTLV